MQMSNSNEVLKKCRRCEIIQVIESFNKDRNRKSSVCPQCRKCWKDFYFKNLDKIKKNNEQKKERKNKHLENKRETDVNFRFITNIRNRIYESLRGMTEQSSTKGILSIDIDTYKRWIEWQMTPEMNWRNIEIDQMKAICLFGVSKDEKKAFNWKYTQTLLKQDHQLEGIKISFLDYQLQFY